MRRPGEGIRREEDDRLHAGLVVVEIARHEIVAAQPLSVDRRRAQDGLPPGMRLAVVQVVQRPQPQEQGHRQIHRRGGGQRRLQPEAPGSRGDRRAPGKARPFPRQAIGGLAGRRPALDRHARPARGLPPAGRPIPGLHVRNEMEAGPLREAPIQPQIPVDQRVHRAACLIAPGQGLDNFLYFTI